ncbi:MAG: hypothetical protein K1X51_00205 [Rhodospirillaceae bacterium]|nr:hypothetical protein [Rhodospirillaceae bacterium]
MATTVILLAWTAAVVAAHAVITRPWKIPAARSPFAILPAIAMTAWVLGVGLLSYNASMASGSWTAASVTLGLIPLKAIVLSLIAHGAGRAAAKALAGGGGAQWGVAAVALALCVYSVAADIGARRNAALEKHAADENLGADEVAALAAKVRANGAGEGEVWAFLGNRLCPPDLLAAAVASSDRNRRIAAARNSALDAAQADRLMTDADEQVRFYLAFNPGLTPEQLAHLSRDVSPQVRGIVALREKLPDDALARLVDDPDTGVREVVALQARISGEALEKLRNDRNERVRNAANRRAR